MSGTATFTHAGATLVTESFSSEASENGSPTYLLIHGIGMGRSVFADLIAHLGDHGMDAHIIAIDLPGYGEAPEPSRVLTMERTADLVAAYLRSRETGPVVIVGHSMGTQVAVEVAARHPAVVGSLVLIAPTADRAERTARAQILRLAQDLLVESPRVIYAGAREYLRAGPHLRAKFHAMLVHRPEETYPRVLAPTLVLRGASDYVCSRTWCRLVTDSLPNARLAEVEGHGHEAMIRDAAPAAALIREFVRHG